MRWRERDGLRWLEAALPGARAAFTTRVGGVSEPPFATLNLGARVGDRAEAVGENRERLARALGRDAGGFLLGAQVHGADVAIRDRAPAPSPYRRPGTATSEADGQLTRAPELTTMVQVADCLPVALAGRGGAGVLHCGWRGLAAGIVERGARAVAAEAAAIGPGIGPCCYSVGAEVLERFAALGPGVASGARLDLLEVTHRLLRRAGVERIEAAGLCTSCERDLFFSHRRDAGAVGATGRQAGLAWIEDRAR